MIRPRRALPRRTGALVAVGLLVACSSSPQVSVSSSATTAPASTVPAATIATSVPVTSAAPSTAGPATTVTPSTAAVVTSVATTQSIATPPTSAAVTTVPATIPGTVPVAAPTLVDTPCRLTPVPAPSSITFRINDHVYELSPDGTVGTCVAALPAGAPTPLAWSPSGAALLVGGGLVIDAKGQRQTGYVANNTGVTWSYPTGKALIAPAVANGALLWRSASNAGTRQDISFLAHTDVAAYHPAGKDIFAVGVDANGVAGVFLASNRGKNPRPIATLDDPTTKILELAPDVSGDHLSFLHDHGTMWEIHQLHFPDLVLQTVFQSNDPISRLTVSALPFSPLAMQVGDCAGPTHTEWVVGATPSVVGAGTALAALSTSPVGWLDNDHLVVTARANGCSGPADVWVAGTDGAVRLVVPAVESVAVRSVVSSYGELPGDINAQAPG